jgi:hypothetical protein
MIQSLEFVSYLLHACELLGLVLFMAACATILQAIALILPDRPDYGTRKENQSGD